MTKWTYNYIEGEWRVHREKEQNPQRHVVVSCEEEAEKVTVILNGEEDDGWIKKNWRNRRILGRRA